MAIKSFSSVSIRDYTDLGQILMYCTSSQPTTVVYDPNASANNAYIPNWATSNLVITPVVQYNGTTLALNASGLVITYTKKEGSAAETSLGTGESVSGGILTVSANKLADVASGLLTYICHVSYTDPEVGVPIDTQSSLTYTLISQASEVKSAYITGENTFLYDTNGTRVGSGTIVLTANVNHVSVQQWQYKQSDGTFAAFPTTNNPSINGPTLNVLDTESGIWLNNDRTAVIKLVTPDANVYDIHQIDKIHDGAAGTATLTAQLSNSSHYVPCDSRGNVTSWNGSTTQIYIYEGGQDVTSTWTVTATPGSGLTGTYNSTTHVFTPSALTDDTSYCDFLCEKSGFSDLTIRYTITKTRMGADGQDAVVYSVEPDVLTINKNISGVYTPSTVTFYAYRKIGSALNNTAYAGRFIIQESTNGSTFSTVYTSDSDESSKIYTPTANATMIKATLYESGGTTNALDEQTVIITRDGQKGDDGDDGVNGISMGLGNYQDVLPCNADGTTSEAKTITIPFYGYSGIQRIPTTATVGTTPNGITVTSNTPANATHDGTIVLSVAKDSALGDASRLTGDITITLSCTYNTQTQSMEQKYTWTKNGKARDGASAVILQIYSEDGGVIRNSSGSTTLTTRLISGATEVTPTAIQWAKYQSGDYVNIAGETSANLVVTANMVDDMAFFRATVSYGGVNNITAFYTVDDVTDPYMSYTFATIQEFKNSQGFGAVYTRVYQNGVEVDPIKSTTFSDTPPSSPSTGDFYYHLDSTNKTCTLKKYNGSAWVNAPAADDDKLTYSYYRNDSNGDPLDVNDPYKTQRCIYVDPSIISGRMVFVCEVTD